MIWHAFSQYLNYTQYFHEPRIYHPIIPLLVSHDLHFVAIVILGILRETLCQSELIHGVYLDSHGTL